MCVTQHVLFQHLTTSSLIYITSLPRDCQFPELEINEILFYWKLAVPTVSSALNSFLININENKQEAFAQ